MDFSASCAQSGFNSFGKYIYNLFVSYDVYGVHKSSSVENTVYGEYPSDYNHFSCDYRRCIPNIVK